MAAALVLELTYTLFNQNRALQLTNSI